MCYTTEYELNNIGASRAIIFTTPSRGINLLQWLKENQPPDKTSHKDDRVTAAYSIDICAWYLHQQSNSGRRKIDGARIMEPQEPGFVGSATNIANPVDALRGVELSLLHELRFLEPF